MLFFSGCVRHDFGPFWLRAPMQPDAMMASGGLPQNAGAIWANAFLGLLEARVGGWKMPCRSSPFTTCLWPLPPQHPGEITPASRSRVTNCFIGGHQIRLSWSWALFSWNSLHTMLDSMLKASWTPPHQLWPSQVSLAQTWPSWPPPLRASLTIWICPSRTWTTCC